VVLHSFPNDALPILKSPWGIASLPDGRLLITEKEGTMRIVDPASGKVSHAITGIPKVDAQGQGGLLGITLDPDFESNRMVYWVRSEEHTSELQSREK